LLAAMAAALRSKIDRDIAFGTAGKDGRELLCNIYHPPPEAPGFPSLKSGRRVGVLIIHGGAWMMGDRMQLDFFAKLLGREGYVCVCNEYRLAEEARWPAMIHDCKAAVRWMRANANRLNIDPDCICAQGNSAGGHLALLLAGSDSGVYPELEGDGGNSGISSAVAACLPVYPPTIMSRPLTAEGMKDMSWFDPAATDRDFALFSPMTYARPTFPPCCFLHGNGDDLVSTADVIKMYQELHSRGAHAELHLFAYAPHAFDADPHLGREVVRLMKVFLDRIFRPESCKYSIDRRKSAGLVPMDELALHASGLDGRSGAPEIQKELRKQGAEQSRL